MIKHQHPEKLQERYVELNKLSSQCLGSGFHYFKYFRCQSFSFNQEIGTLDALDTISTYNTEDLIKELIELSRDCLKTMADLEFRLREYQLFGVVIRYPMKIRIKKFLADKVQRLKNLRPKRSK